LEDYSSEPWLGSSNSLEKIFMGKLSRCLGHPLPLLNSSFQKLCSKAYLLINTHAYWVRSNGKRINLWADRIWTRNHWENAPPSKGCVGGWMLVCVPGGYLSLAGISLGWMENWNAPRFGYRTWGTTLQTSWISSIVDAKQGY